MKRAILAAVLVILTWVATTTAQEVYPAGTDSLTIYGIGAVGIGAHTVGDTTITDTDGTFRLGRINGSPNNMAVMKFPLDAVPSGKALVKVALHVHVANSKLMTDPATFEVSRLLASYDSTAVTGSKRNATNQWYGDNVLIRAGSAADTEYNLASANIRDYAEAAMPDGFSKAAGVDYEMTADITGLARGWYSGLFENNGILLRYRQTDCATGDTMPEIDFSANPAYLKVYYVDVGGGGSAGRGRYIGERP